MKKILIYTLSTLLIFMISACSSHRNILSISEAHEYNEDFGLRQNDTADKEIDKELLTMNLPTEIDIPIDINPEWTTELTKDPDAFYADEYVEKPEVITYKYEFDKKFYDYAEWRKAEF